jgi:hypothetical protein
MNQASGEQLIRDVFHEGTPIPNSRERLSELFRDDFSCHGPPGVNHSHDDGPEPIERCLFGGAFADLVFTINGVEVEGDRIVAAFVATGRQIELYQGVPPAAERSIEGTATFRVEGERLAEGWGILRG